MTYDEACRELADAHGSDQTLHDLRIYRVQDPSAQEVRFVEVSDGFPRNTYVDLSRGNGNGNGIGGAATALNIVPVVRFGRSRDFPYRSAVALVTPEEYQLIQAGELIVGDSWDIGRAEMVWPSQ